MKMKTRCNIASKLPVLISFILVMAFLFSSCASTGSSSKNAMPEIAGGADYGRSGGFTGETTTMADSSYVKTDENFTDQSLAGSTNGSGNGDSSADIRKIIKNGEIAVEVPSVDSSYKAIIDIVKKLGGEEFNKNLYTSGDFKKMTLVVKIPPEKLEQFQAELTTLVGESKIRSININSSDISAQYYDIAARLQTNKDSREQLRELLKRAQTVEDTLRVQNEITRIQGDIDSMQGQINMWDKLVSMSTITLYIDEEDDPIKRTKDTDWKFNSISEVWRSMKNGFIITVNTLYSIVMWIVIVFVSLLPILIPVGIFIFLILYFKRKRKGRKLPEQKS